MLMRSITIGVIAVAGWLVASANAKEPVDGTHTGIVVSTTADELRMSDEDGKNQHTHSITADTKVTLDGKDAKITDLKVGQKVSVTIKGGKVTLAAAESALG